MAPHRFFKINGKIETECGEKVKNPNLSVMNQQVTYNHSKGEWDTTNLFSQIR